MNAIFHLYQLQKIDLLLDQIQARLQEIDRLCNNRSEILSAEKVCEEIQTRINEQTGIIHQIEADARARRIKADQNSSSLYSGKVKNPKELSDLEKEVASLRKYVAELEDQQLQQMMVLEQLEGEHSIASEALAAVQSQMSALVSVLGSETTGLLKEKERLLVEREITRAQAPEEMRSLYEKLRQQKKGIAVATIEDMSCAACGSTITPAQWQAARSPQKIITCPACGRILYAG